VQSIIFKWSITNFLYLSHAFWVAGKPTCILLKRFDILSSAVKKGEDKKVQIIEQPEDVISLWGQEEKLGCMYRTPTFKVFKWVAGVLYTQYSFSSWPQSDSTSLDHSVTCTLPFLHQRCFGIGFFTLGWFLVQS